MTEPDRLTATWATASTPPARSTPRWRRALPGADAVLAVALLLAADLVIVVIAGAVLAVRWIARGSGDGCVTEFQASIQANNTAYATLAVFVVAGGVVALRWRGVAVPVLATQLLIIVIAIPILIAARDRAHDAAHRDPAEARSCQGVIAT